MSEYVVKMEMPNNHCPVRFSIAATGYCLIADRHGCGLDVTKERPDWCPIVCQLPEGHGRLVDASTVMGAIRLEDLIRKSNVPTIVPADTAERNKT